MNVKKQARKRLLFAKKQAQKQEKCFYRSFQKQQKITSDIFCALKLFREKYLRDATYEEFQQIGKDAEKAYRRELHTKRKSIIANNLIATM